MENPNQTHNVCLNERQRQKIKKAKVKTGCKTCKMRRVKCDEGRPACNRCASTGRKCDGYGISREQNPGSQNYRYGIIIPASKTFSIRMTADENYYLEWYTHRTARKIPGAFTVKFWQTLLMQASFNEPAALNAVLTLSSVHKRENVQRDQLPDEQEQFMLQHYSKAITCLKPHFSKRNERSVQVALITCVVFICLELLRGRFRTAQMHLENGLTVLKEASSVDDRGFLNSDSPHRELVDNMIVEAFCRLQFQVVLFNSTWQDPNYLLQYPSIPSTPPLLFPSIVEAWKALEHLMSRTFLLSRRRKGYQTPESLTLNYPALLNERTDIQSDLAHWLTIFMASEPYLKPWARAHPLLHIHYLMTTIMNLICLSPNDELIYDSDTVLEKFCSIITHCIAISPPGSSIVLPGHDHNMSRSIIDMGWVPPLYYTALKCRVLSVRSKAVELLESASHREGVWDSKISACVARKVIEIEEEGRKNEEVLGSESRIWDIKVSLPDGPGDAIGLCYKRREDTGEVRVWDKQFRVSEQCWVNR